MQIEVITKTDLDQLNRKIDNLAQLIVDGIPPAKEPANGLLTREEARKKLRISLTTLDKLAGEGKLKAIRLKGRVLYKASEIERNLEALQDGKYKK